MTTKQYDQFFELLDQIVQDSGSWGEKKKKLLDAASESDSTNLEELAGWFSEPAP